MKRLAAVLALALLVPALSAHAQGVTVLAPGSGDSLVVTDGAAANAPGIVTPYGPYGPHLATTPAGPSPVARFAHSGIDTEIVHLHAGRYSVHYAAHLDTSRGYLGGWLSGPDYYYQLVINDICPCAGQSGIIIPTDGDYTLEVHGRGPWEVQIIAD